MAKDASPPSWISHCLLPQAEECFHQALDTARSQDVKSLELRAATSLARLWQSQDKHQDAYELLERVYGWFTEGFDTADEAFAKVTFTPDPLKGLTRPQWRARSRADVERLIGVPLPGGGQSNPQPPQL